MPSPPVVYGGPSVMIAPGATAVTTGPDIVDIAVISIFLIMAAGAATSMMRDVGAADRITAGRLQKAMFMVLLACSTCICA